jgi:RND family efflux transporter MFP subunit
MTDPAPPPARRRLAARLIPIGVLVLAVGVGYVLTQTPPTAESRPAEQQATLVEVRTLDFTTRPVRVEAMGTVQPAQSVELMPRVGGEVASVNPNFIPGGVFKTGDQLLQIDPLDYELARRAAETVVTEAATALRIEQGAQAVAVQDFELLGEVVTERDQDLVLRKPQLEMAQANLASAEAALAVATVDLARTTVNAPFNAIVDDRPLSAGARVTPSTPVATLIGTDHYWIEVTLPVSDLKWITFPGPNDVVGSTVTITDDAAWAAGQTRTGTVLRLAASLEALGRLARVIVEVPDPLGLADPTLPRLLIGSFVRAEFEGRELENVAALPRDLLHADDRVWLLTDDGTLDIRDVQVALRGRDDVLIASGVAPGDRIITTNLSTPVQGIPLRVEE